MFPLPSCGKIRYNARMDDGTEATASDNVALNPKFRHQEAMLLNALLQSSDYGVLVSGLDREDIVANRRLGELFGVSPRHVVEMAPDAVRALALSRVRDPQAFQEVLNRVYADPLLTHEDEIALVGEPPRTLHRYTAPIFGLDHQPAGRLWTFLDISETKRLQSEVEAQLAARTREYATTAEILRAMNALCSITTRHGTTDDLLAAIVQQTRGLSRCDCAATLLLTESAQEPTQTAKPEAAAGKSVRLEGWACAPGKPVKSVCVTMESDPALFDALAQAAQPPPQTCDASPLTLIPRYKGLLAKRLQWQALAIAPLCSQNIPRGVFVVGIPRPHAGSGGKAKALPRAAVPDEALPSPVELHHLHAVADQIALTLDAHRLQSELRATLDTLQLTQRRMVEMEKLRTAGTLAASVAHDIRNILTAMQMDMETTWPPDEMPEGLRDHLNRFSTLTHRLLAFSQPARLELRPLNVGDLLRQVVSLVGGQAQIHAVQISVDLPPDLPLIAADAAQLEHLFINLCLNAIQSMTLRGGRLYLRGATTREHLTVEVTDTGTGIAPDVIERIFEPFFTTRATGTGLGLFSCKRIAEEHHGHLRVCSVLNEGTTFFTLLPIL